MSIHLIFIILSKLKQKKEFMLEFGSYAECATDVENVDWDTSTSGMFNECNDWITLLNYVEISSSDNNLEEDVCIARFMECLVKGNLASEYNCTTDFIAYLLLHVMLQDVPSAKSLEQRLSMISAKQASRVSKDIELRCLRCVAAFSDEHMDEAVIACGLQKIMKSMVVKAEFFRDVNEILRAQENLLMTSKTDQARECGRLQLRKIVKTLHKSAGMTYTSTFEAWSTQQKFSVTTTRRLQLFLYFIKTQQKKVTLHNVKHLFSDSIIRKLDEQSIDYIDHRAISNVIQSIRICSHNVRSLLEFRTSCLNGINSRYKNSLSMAQILQLYVCCYQHGSIREQCWRSVVPVWNFTIETACNKFREQYEYDVDSVIQCIVGCMIDGWKSEE